MRLLTSQQLEALRAAPLDGSVPNRLRIAMAILGVGQAELVAGTGFTQPYVSDVMRGRFKGITVENAQRFADFFGCQIEDLFPPRRDRRQWVLRGRRPTDVALLTKTTADGITVEGTFDVDPDVNTQEVVVDILDTDTETLDAGLYRHR